MTDRNATPSDNAPAKGNSDGRAFFLTAALGAVLIPAAFGLALGLSIDLMALIEPGFAEVFYGLAAAAPLIALLRWFMVTRWRPLVNFRASQLKFLSEVGFLFTRPRIIVLAAIAGIGEELMFRGVLQTAADRQWPLAAAILFPSVLFGLLHARTALYAVVAGLVGAYLGILYWATESLLAPIITHAFYDYVAFDWTRRALAKAGLSDQSGRAKSSASSVTG